MMRPLELLGRILAQGYHAEMKNMSNGLLLAVKLQHPLSRFVGQMIRNEGFKFKYSYNEKNGRSVIIFYKDCDIELYTN